MLLHFTKSLGFRQEVGMASKFDSPEEMFLVEKRTHLSIYIYILGAA